MTHADWVKDRDYFEAYKRAERDAIRHVRTQLPELWETLINQAMADKGIIRRKPGRPKKVTS